jgi:hypothetical protein
VRSICPHEEAVARAVRTRRWEDFLSSHVKTCEACSETVFVSAWMCELAESSLEDRLLPDAGVTWFNAQTRKVLIAEERASRPLNLVQNATCLAGATWLAVHWSSVWRILGDWRNGLGSHIASLSLSPMAELLALGLIFACVAYFWPVLHPRSE